MEAGLAKSGKGKEAVMIDLLEEAAIWTRVISVLRAAQAHWKANE
jgi:hypothetical protein